MKLLHIPRINYSREIALWQNYRSPLVNIAETFSNDFKLHWYQKKIFASIEKNQRSYIVASRQIGKTETLSRYAIAHALAYQDQMILIFSSGERHSKEILRRIRRMIARSPIPIRLVTDNRGEIEFFNGSRIISLPNNTATAPGYPANLILIDETDSIRDFDGFQGSVFPSTSRVAGKIVCSGTFWGKNALWELHNGKPGKPWSKWPGVLMPYTVNPPPTIQQEYRDLRESVFKQQYECVPMDATGSLFPSDLWESCVLRDRQTGQGIIDTNKYTYHEESIYFGGYDPAKFVDNSILCGIELPSQDKLRLMLLQNYFGLNYRQQAQEIKAAHNDLHFYKLCMDATGAGGTFEIVEAAIGSTAEPVIFNNNSKAKMINDFRIAIQDREIWLPDDPQLKSEFHDLDPKTLDHRPNGSSDRAWATCLAWKAYEDFSKNYYTSNDLDLSHTPTQ